MLFNDYMRYTEATHTHIHTITHTDTRTYTHTHTHTHIQTLVHTHTHTHTDTRTHTHIQTLVHTHTHTRSLPNFWKSVAFVLALGIPLTTRSRGVDLPEIVHEFPNCLIRITECFEHS